MAIFPKTKRAASKKAAKGQKKADKAAKNAGGSIQTALESVGPLAAVAAGEARDLATDAYKTYAPKAEKAAKQARKNLKNSNVADRAQKLSEDVKGDYLPRAKNTADATNATVSAAVAAAVDAARKEWEKGSVDIKKAAAKPVKKKRGLGVLGLLVGLAAGGAVAYVVWQKTRPIEDPWAPPADFARAHYPAAASTDADSRDVSDSVASAEAGDVSDALQGGKKKPLDPTHPTAEPGIEGKIGEKKPNENQSKK